MSCRVFSVLHVIAVILHVAPIYLMWEAQGIWSLLFYLVIFSAILNVALAVYYWFKERWEVTPELPIRIDWKHEGF